MKKIFTTLALSFPMLSYGGSASFQVIEDIAYQKAPSAVSNLGHVISGNILWSSRDGVQFNDETLTDVSPDGSILLGKYGKKYINGQVFTMPYDPRSLELFAMSGDGSVVGGGFRDYNFPGDNDEYRVQQLWKEGRGFIVEGEYSVTDISRDGRFAVGNYTSYRSVFIDVERETSEDWSSLALPDCDAQSSGLCGELRLESVSSTGVVVGSIASAPPYKYREQPAYWEQGVPVRLGGLNPNNEMGTLLSISENGKVAVGWSTTDDDLSDRNGQYAEAIIWDKVNGIRSLEDVLVDQYDIDLEGWKLLRATAISHDGYSIAGIAVNEEKGSSLWLVQLTDECSVSSW